MERDARRMHGDGPFIFAQVTHGQGVQAIADHLLGTWKQATSRQRA